jgi:hypothetical protein
MEIIEYLEEQVRERGLAKVVLLILRDLTLLFILIAFAFIAFYSQS